MSASVQTTVICQDPGDGSGDVIIELSPAILAELKIGLGDSLSIELVDGLIVLKPVPDAEEKP
ncbi:AbrB/MazE/SpoVT family DNA-binding domain-containing protein [Pseudomonas cichorii]|nr:AbrB/MazE/SpoVT family DNA-binding domain-containing protein [Pseudomonas cichorii]